MTSPAMIETAVSSYLDAAGRRTDASTEAYESLLAEMLNALRTDVQTLVSTPAWGAKQSKAAAVVEDILSDVNPRHLLAVLQIVAQGARGADVRQACADWQRDVAREYAETHCDDLALVTDDDRADYECDAQRDAAFAD